MCDDRGPGFHKTRVLLRRLRLLSWSWGRIVCQVSNSRNVTLRDRLYATAPFRWLGSLNAQRPRYLTAGNTRSLDPFTQFVRRHLISPEAHAPTIPPPRRRREPSSLLLQATFHSPTLPPIPIRRPFRHPRLRDSARAGRLAPEALFGRPPAPAHARPQGGPLTALTSAGSRNASRWRNDRIWAAPESCPRL